MSAAAVAPEDEARAGLYALLARLLAAGPDLALQQLLVRWGDALEGDAPLALAGRALADAARATAAAAARVEYDTVFIGVGKAPVTPYLSHYLVPVGQDKVLVELRDTLAHLGLARDAESSEPEDHVAAVLEVMRHLCLRAPDASTLEDQRAFFFEYLAPAYAHLCGAIRDSERTAFYRPVALLMERFLDTERDGFELT